jgi:hypothetical protein
LHKNVKVLVVIGLFLIANKMARPLCIQLLISKWCAKNFCVELLFYKKMKLDSGKIENSPQNFQKESRV